jgi:hypothetical protein
MTPKTGVDATIEALGRKVLFVAGAAFGRYLCCHARLDKDGIELCSGWLSTSQVAYLILLYILWHCMHGVVVQRSGIIFVELHSFPDATSTNKSLLSTTSSGADNYRQPSYSLHTSVYHQFCICTRHSRLLTSTVTLSYNSPFSCPPVPAFVMTGT